MRLMDCERWKRAKVSAMSFEEKKKKTAAEKESKNPKVASVRRPPLTAEFPFATSKHFHHRQPPTLDISAFHSNIFITSLALTGSRPCNRPTSTLCHLRDFSPIFQFFSLKSLSRVHFVVFRCFRFSFDLPQNFFASSSARREGQRKSRRKICLRLSFNCMPNIGSDLLISRATETAARPLISVSRKVVSEFYLERTNWTSSG